MRQELMFTRARFGAVHEPAGAVCMPGSPVLRASARIVQRNFSPFNEVRAPQCLNQFPAVACARNRATWARFLRLE
jgi:hypothetical protein